MFVTVKFLPGWVAFRRHAMLSPYLHSSDQLFGREETEGRAIGRYGDVT
jgi:hypothetical protein